MKTVRDLLTGLRTHHWFFLFFAIAFLMRAAGVVVSHQYLKVERFELERTALSLSFTGVYGNPYAIPTGPTAHVSPGYTVVLALIFHVFGTGVRGEVVKEMIACAVTAVQCALMPLVAAQFGFGRLAGILAGFAASLLPLKFVTETQGDWESNWAALGLMLVSVITIQTWRRRSFTVPEAVANGLGWGFTLLFSWTYAPLYAAFLLCGVFIAKHARLRRYLTFGAVAISLTALVLSPWILRNWRAFRAFVPGRTNTGIELRLSNNNDAVAREGVNFRSGVYHLYHPLQSVTEAKKVAQLGEVEYNKRLITEAKNWMISHPAKFAELTLDRFGLFWFYPDREHLPKTVILWLRTALAFFGLYIAWRAGLVSAWVTAVVLLVVPLPNYLVHVAPKHSYSVDWLFTLFAALAVSALLEKRPYLRV